MKRNYLFILATFLFVILSFSKSWSQPPTFTWAKEMGGTGGDAGYSIVTDASGNVFTTGVFVGTVDFDPGAGVFNLTSAGGSTDIFISKLDSSGNFVWAEAMGGTNVDYSRSIALDTFGNVYTTGYFKGTADFDPGAGTFNLTSAGVEDIFISKVDASGNFIWAKSIGGTDYDYGYFIALDALGNVYTTGFFEGTVDFDPGAGTFNLTSASSWWDIFISKLDASGNFVWAKRMGGFGYDYGYSIALDDSFNVYTTGYFNQIADFDPGVGVFNLTPASAFNYDIFISKLDVSGNFIWAKAMGGTGGDVGISIAIDTSGNVYTTGSFEDTADFDPGAGTFNLISAGSNDIFISKLDSSGNFVWAEAMGGTNYEYGNSISIDASDNVYTIGYFEGTADFDPGAGTFNLISAGLRDIFISKLDASGNFVWAKRMGATNFDYGNSITIDASSNVYTTGSFLGTVDFDPGSGTFNLTSAGGSDIFVHKMADCSVPATPSSISGSTTICSSSLNTYIITSVSGATSYTWILPGGWSGTSTTNSITTTASSTNGNISVTANNACGSSAAQTLSVTVDPVLIPTISIFAAPAGAICAGTNVTFTASITNGGSSPNYQWKLNGGNVGTNSNTYSSSTLNNGDIITCILTSNALCASPTTVTSNSIAIVVNTVNTSVSQSGITLTANAIGAAYQWINCLGNIPILGETNQSFTATSNGDYAVIVTQSSCTDTSSCFNINSVGIAENSFANTVNIYPNPGSGIFTLSLSIMPKSLTDMRLVNTLGQVIYSGILQSQVQQFDFSNLVAGTYYLLITNDGEQISKRIIITK